MLSDLREIGVRNVSMFAKYLGAETMTAEAPARALPTYGGLAKEYGIMARLYDRPVGRKVGMAEPPYSTPEKTVSARALCGSLGEFPDCGDWERSGFDIIKSA